MSVTRRYRGLRLSDDAHNQLRDLKIALEKDMYEIVEEAVARTYELHRADPRHGPILDRLAEVREVQRVQRVARGSQHA
ncbi:hypothetical protein [Symbiobacterium terraclitae]|uniref:hypothetical protein n=1 Tax=Symbiobacterium terraclitae TaxID=557451 RepID=UPI0035B54726